MLDAAVVKRGWHQQGQQGRRNVGLNIATRRWNESVGDSAMGAPRFEEED